MQDAPKRRLTDSQTESRKSDSYSLMAEFGDFVAKELQPALSHCTCRPEN